MALEDVNNLSAMTIAARLPDDMFLYQKSKFGHILHREHCNGKCWYNFMAVWNILR
jgi:hypothetical protein